MKNKKKRKTGKKNENDSVILLTINRQMDNDLLELKNSNYLKNNIWGALTKQKLIRHAITQLITNVRKMDCEEWVKGQIKKENEKTEEQKKSDDELLENAMKDLNVAKAKRKYKKKSSKVSHG